MRSLSGTKTEANIIAAFVAEAQANTKYKFFASKAREDGYNEIADVFDETANNERAHARIWYKYLHSNEIPATDCNLSEAIEGENFEYNNMYPECAKVAAEEGFTEIAKLFELIGKIEEQHETRFKQLLKNVDDSKVFSKDGTAIWVCMNCGNVVVGKSAPQQCPVCKKPQAYFKEKVQ